LRPLSAFRLAGLLQLALRCGSVMDRCCIESLALKGIADGFRLTPEGGGWTCDCCGRYYQIAGGLWRDAYQCPRCGAVSFNANDIQQRYCVACHQFEQL
jgi:ribosomal protein S27AE